MIGWLDALTYLILTFPTKRCAITVPKFNSVPVEKICTTKEKRTMNKILREYRVKATSRASAEMGINNWSQDQDFLQLYCLVFP